MDKIDYKKDYKELYLPKDKPVIFTVPPINFITVEGKGDPNEEEFSHAVEALYSISYAIKMSYKSNNIPKGYYQYTVFPLEGVWDLVDKTLPSNIKSNYKYTIMIRQPDFVTPELFEKFLGETKKKKPNAYLDIAKFETITEGICCQILHLGSYDDETISFKKMDQFCNDNGYERICLTHREIYLSDPRRTEVQKLKTVLRYKVKGKRL